MENDINSKIFDIDAKILKVDKTTNDLNVNSTKSWADVVAGSCLSRALISKNVKTWMLLYQGYIRSILEYGLTAYCPYQKGQLAALEGVQRWMTRQVPGIGRLP